MILDLKKKKIRRKMEKSENDKKRNMEKVVSKINPTFTVSFKSGDRFWVTLPYAACSYAQSSPKARLKSSNYLDAEKVNSMERFSTKVVNMNTEMIYH